MDPFVTSMATSAAYDLSKATVHCIWNTAVKIKPGLVTRAQTTVTQDDIDDIFREAVGVIVAEADAGTITLDQPVIEALNGVKFDHQNGAVVMSKAKILSSVIRTGGSNNATGTTVIDGNTSLQSKNTVLTLGNGARLKLSGGATMTQPNRRRLEYRPHLAHAIRKSRRQVISSCRLVARNAGKYRHFIGKAMLRELLNPVVDTHGVSRSTDQIDASMELERCVALLL